MIKIKQAVRKLSLAQLKRLDEWLHEVILKADESAQAERIPTRKQIVDDHTVENKTYRLEVIRCGKETCKCARGKPHGPYWYSYTRVQGKIISQYVGKKLPREVEKSLNKGMKL
ncbi:MAG TPA: DUF6788 family protein [Pyrinomonadaceae bacterium]